MELDLNDINQKKARIAKAGHLHWIHWSVVGGSLILTFVAWYFASQQVQKQVEDRFHREAEQVVALISERMRKYEDALWSGVAAVQSHNSLIDTKKWKQFSDTLRIEEKYPGINGIGVIHRVEPSQLNRYLAEERKFRPNYKIHPPHQQKEFWPITHIEPVASNKKAVGLDMAHETNRFTAAKKARDTGIAQVTGPIILVQDAKKTPGFLFYAPFYKGGQNYSTVEERQKNFIGLVYAPFIFSKLMEGTLQADKRNVTVRVNDADSILFNEMKPEFSNYDPNPLYSREFDIAEYGRTWHLTITSGNSFRTINTSSQPLIILFGGILIDALLLTLFLMLARANRQTIAFADEVTVNYQIQEKKLREANADLEDFAYVASHDLKAPLRVIDNSSQWLEEDLADQLNEESKKDLALLRNRVQRMDKLLDDLLSYSRMGRVSDERYQEKIRGDKLIDDILLLLTPSEKWNISISKKFSDITVVRMPLQQVLYNLINNAIKHHDKDAGRIELDVEVLADGLLKYTVKDDGPGIPGEFHQKVFKLFQTLKPRDKVEGSGMGLALVKRIIDRYGGSLTLDSEPGKGCVFSFTLPAKIQDNSDGANEVANAAA